MLNYEFEIQLHLYVYFKTKAAWESYESPNLLNYELNSTNAVLQEWRWY